MVSHFVVNMLIIRDGRVLLERVHGAYWKLPGGHIEAGESPDDSVVREAQEELGLEVNFLGYEKLFPDTDIARSLPVPFSSALHVVDSDSALAERHANIIFSYAVAPENDPVPRDGQEIRWFGPEELEADEIKHRVRAIVESGLAYCRNLGALGTNS